MTKQVQYYRGWHYIYMYCGWDFFYSSGCAEDILKKYASGDYFIGTDGLYIENDQDLLIFNLCFPYEEYGIERPC